MGTAPAAATASSARLGAADAQSPQGSSQTARLYQFSTLDALMAGHYDGEISNTALLARGDFGLGAADALSGELIVLDGVSYRIREDGSADVLPASARVPFACVTFFKPTIALKYGEPLKHTALYAALDARLPVNRPLAVRARGSFSKLRFRVPRQPGKPYPPLAELVKTQAVFSLEQTRGTLVGFRLPDALRGSNVAGYHFHFLREDGRTGGHVLDFTLADLQVDVAVLTGQDVDFPDGAAYDALPLKPGSDDLHGIER